MKITDTIHTLKIPFQIPISDDTKIDRFVYMYIIFGEKIYLIDTAVSEAKDLIFNYIYENNRLPKEIYAIYLTHAHPDHIGAAKSIQDETGCKIFIHENEIEWIQDIDKQFAERPIPGFYKIVAGSARAENLIIGQNLFLEKNISFNIYNTPGHSNGSVSYLFNEERVLFTGDAIILPGELPIYDDVEAYLKSLDALRDLKKINIILSAWDEPKMNNEIQDVYLKSYNYINLIHNKFKKVYKPGDENELLVFCRKVLKSLKIPEMLANPILAKSFLAHLKIIDLNLENQFVIKNNFLCQA